MKKNISKEDLAEELVAKAISHGSPDNVTVIVIDLEELYKRWQRSTPFQGSSKSSNPFFVTEDLEETRLETEELHSKCANDCQTKRKSRSEKSRATTEDIDMDAEDHVYSPFSGPSCNTYGNWKR